MVPLFAVVGLCVSGASLLAELSPLIAVGKRCLQGRRAFSVMNCVA